MKEALRNIRGDQKLDNNIKVRVLDAKILNDLDFIELDVEENNTIFQNIIVIKGEIYPLPKKDDSLNIKQIYFDYDYRLIFRVFIKAEICKSFDNVIFSNDNNKEILSFSQNKIYQSLKTICNIQDNLYTNLFKLDSIDKNFSYLFCIQDLNYYKISNKLITSAFKSDDFFIITNYILNKNEISSNNLTIIKKLKEEEKIFQWFYRLNEKMKLFKVIDINEKNYICIDSNKNLYQVEKNKELEALNIKICQLLIVNYSINENSKCLLNKIKLNKNSIIKISEQDIYFSKLIPINHISVIYVHFLDYQKNNNLYDTLIIDGKEIKINNDEVYYIIPSLYKDFDFYPLNISLAKSDDINLKKDYKFILYQGLLNKINAFINFFSHKTYFIEYFSMSIDFPIIKINTKIYFEINKIQYELKYFDNFQSENRKRINCLNVPFQYIDNFDEKKLRKINSIQICNILEQNKNMIFGIFDINEMDSKEEQNDNSYFDNYYSEFGNIISLFDDKNIKFEKLREICLDIYSKSEINKSKDIILSTYCDELTLSQYKTRIGLLLCYYFNLYKDEMEEIIGCYYYIAAQMVRVNITLLQRLRIIIFYLDKKLSNSGSINEIIFLSKFNKNSPYVLASEFNKSEIKHINEFSRYFTVYLQLDSFIVTNYYIDELSFTFSLELLFVMKHYLLSFYEDFIFTTTENSDEYAYMSEQHNITVINERNIFSQEINYKKIRKLDNIEISKNYALPISFEFRHEKNSHQKRKNKNPRVFSPFVFYKDGKFERIKKKIKINGNEIIEKGESGRMVESYLTEDNKIFLLLKNIPIFGDLLDYTYYIEKDFSRLLKKMDEIKIINKKYFLDENGSYNQLFDKKENNIQLEKEKISELYDKTLKEEGKIRFGDVHYSIEEFNKYLKNWKMKNFFKNNK